MNICIVAGARPNFIKVAPLVRAIQRTEGIGYQLVYTGAESDPSLEGTLFDDLQIPRPDFYLGVDCENLNELTGQVMSAFEHYLLRRPADVVIVVDDLASTMAAAIVTKKQGIRLAHLVAGTRSFDIRMPKEINRLVIDGLSDLLFTAGVSNTSNTNREGAEQSRVYMVGNILIDNLRFNHSRWQRPKLMDEMALRDGDYIVFTLNRKALLADTANLRLMLDAILGAAGDVPVVALLRENAREVVGDTFLRTHEPLPYLEFGWLTAHAKGIITDSGNVAEEATFNGVPCITLNSYTEHIETVKQGTNELVGEDAGKLADAVGRMVRGTWKHHELPDRWDGRTAERILQILQSES
ncbi:MAG: UDP-N-acetyl glucosamine 2-epimerase [Prevotella sp.]|nr:UDP-N-acetyl glucosamine 2-epimerase [Prevotella sp.]